MREYAMQHLPIHPLTGLRAVYVDKYGTPRYPIMGASDDGDAGDSGGDSGDTGDDDGDSGDGDKGGDDAENKLAQARQEAIDRRKELKPWRDLGKELGLTPEEIRSALKTKGGKKDDDKGDQPDADQIRREAEREALAKADARILRAEVRALAAETFANPADALHNLNLDDYGVTEDGELEDAEAVKSALADVLRKNPHYAKKGKAPKPDPSQGPRGGAKPEVAPGIGRIRAAYAESSK